MLPHKKFKFEGECCSCGTWFHQTHPRSWCSVMYVPLMHNNTKLQIWCLRSQSLPWAAYYLGFKPFFLFFLRLKADKTNTKCIKNWRKRTHNEGSQDPLDMKHRHVKSNNKRPHQGQPTGPAEPGTNLTPPALGIQIHWVILLHKISRGLPQSQGGHDM